MAVRYLAGALLALAAITGPAGARATIDIDDDAGGGGETAQTPYLECVPFAREVSGIRIYGDAHTWWEQAEGRYARGSKPRVGAVMAFEPGGNSHLGHVAAVSRIIDSRTVLISHANWSPINGRRGQIERDVRAVDVSPDNDWSEVRVWYAPIQSLGARHWALSGFIYNQKPGAAKPEKARLERIARTTAEKTELARALSSAGRTGELAGKPSRLPKGSDPIGAIIARSEG